MTRCSPFDARFVGDPVDVITGEVQDIATDFSMGGEPVFHWNRHYHGSRVDEDRGLGRGHRHVFDWALRTDLDGLTLEGPEAPVAFPPLHTDGEQLVHRGWRLERVSATVLRARRAGEPTREFVRSTPGALVARLHRLLHPDGTETRLEYHERRGDPRLVAVYDPRGWVLRLEWGKDHLDAIHAQGTFGTLTVASYEYDAGGHLVRVRDAYGHASEWAYDAMHRVVRRADRRGYAFVYRYDARGRCTRTAGEDDVDAVSLVYLPDLYETRVRHEANGAQWSYRWDPSGNLQEIEDPYGGTRQFLYDADGLQVGEIDGGGGKWTLVHDAADRTLGKRDPLGHLHPPHEDPTAPEHDPLAHRPAATTMAQELGELAAAKVDVPKALTFAAGLPAALGAVLLTCEHTGAPREVRDPQGLLLREDRVYEGGAGTARRWVYDPNGNPRKYRDHDGGEWHWEYASWNHRVSERDPLGGEVRLGYSKRDVVERVEDAGGTVTQYEWDLCDRLAGVSRHGKVRERYAYDRAGAFVEKCGGDGQVLVRYERGALGTLLRRTSHDGVDERFRRDPRGRILRASSTTEGGATYAVEFAYDPLGQRARDARDDGGVEHEHRGGRLARTSVRVAGAGGAMGRAYETTYVTGADGVLEITDPAGGVHRIREVAAGVYLREHANGTTEIAQYDDEGRCVAKASESAAGPWQRRFYRSGEGDLLARDDTRRGLTRYGYDAAHRLTAVQHPTGEVDGYVHDAAGNLRSQPGLSEGRVPHSSAAFAGQVFGEPTAVGPGNRLLRANEDAFEHDARDHLCARKGDWGQLRYVRDGLDRLRRIERTGAGHEQPTVVWEADYDALGRRTCKRVHDGEDVQTTRFFWDTDRLAAEVLPDGRVRIYIYASPRALVPMLAMEYASAEAEPEAGTVYVFHTDHRGAVEQVEDAAGEIVWEAAVSPYGAATVYVGEDFHQPFRLVGQYHDDETGLSVTRYRNWSPELGRFLESDPIGLAGGLNVYAWPGCPLRESDPLGLGCDETDGVDANNTKEEGADQESSFVRFTDDYDTHISTQDTGVQRKKGIGGAHNLQEFNNALNNMGGRVIARTPHPTVKGLQSINYQLPALDMKGQPTGEFRSQVFTKSTYDPATISDQQFAQWGRQAAAQAQSQGPLGREWTGTAPNGVIFRGFTDDTGAVRTFFPEIDEK